MSQDTTLPPLPRAAVDENNLQGGRLLYTRNQMHAYARAAIAAQAQQDQGVPAGHKATPYEPTQAMLIAARDIDPALPIEHARRLWWLMWAAAPQAEPRPEPAPQQESNE